MVVTLTKNTYVEAYPNGDGPIGTSNLEPRTSTSAPGRTCRA